MSRPKTVPVTVTTATVGDLFATVGVVKRRGQTIHRTREVPYNFIEAAMKLALAWADEQGYQIDAGND